MRILVPHVLSVIALLTICAGCASQEGAQWQKAGTDQQTLSRDSAECREAAQEGAVRRYPYRAASAGFGATGAALSQQRDDNSRAVAEASLFNGCMQGRGYRRP